MITLKPLKKDLKPLKNKQCQSSKILKAEVTALKLMLQKTVNKFIKN